MKVWLLMHAVGRSHTAGPGDKFRNRPSYLTARMQVGVSLSQPTNVLLANVLLTSVESTDFESDDGLLELRQTRRMTTNFESDDRLRER